MLRTLEAIGFGGLGTTELLIVLGILVLLFGASRIPEVARSLGSGIRDFRKGLKEDPEPKKLEGEPQEGADATASSQTQTTSQNSES